MNAFRQGLDARDVGPFHPHHLYHPALQHHLSNNPAVLEALRKQQAALALSKRLSQHSGSMDYADHHHHHHHDELRLPVDIDVERLSSHSHTETAV